MYLRLESRSRYDGTAIFVDYDLYALLLRHDFATTCHDCFEHVGYSQYDLLDLKTVPRQYCDLHNRSTIVKSIIFYSLEIVVRSWPSVTGPGVYYKCC